MPMQLAQGAGLDDEQRTGHGGRDREFQPDTLRMVPPANTSGFCASS